MDTYEVEGSLWRVTQQFASNQSHTLVIPQPYHLGPANIANQQYPQGWGLVIKGMSISVVASAAATVSLLAADPWVGDGDDLQNDPIMVWSFAAGTVADSCAPMQVPLSKGGYRFDYSSPSGANGAQLLLTTSATGITAGCLLVWGIHTQYAYGRHAETSSPADFTT